MRVYNISQIQLIRQMGFEELIDIVKECRSILVNINGSERYLQLIKRMDDEVRNYEISRQNYVKVDLKNRFQCPNEQHSQEQSRFSSLQNSSVSKFSPVSIKRIQSSPKAPLSNTNRFDQQEQISVNNSLSQSWIKNVQSSKVKNEKIMSNNETIEFEVDDFFVIDYSFDKGEYEILPKKAHFYDKWQDDQYFEATDKKDNKEGATEGIFPFAMIEQNSKSRIQANGKSSIIQSNGNANRSMIRSSMQVQIGTSNSRLQLISSKQKQQQKQVQYLYETRQVIRNLLISSSLSTHIKPIKLTSSMTDLLKLTTNPSSKNSHLEHLVLPSFLQIRTQDNKQQCDRYTHIIKTIEGVKYQDKHYECERFWVIVEKGRKFFHVERVIRKLIKRLFEIRVSKDREVENVEFSNVRKYLEKICLYPKNELYTLLNHSNLSDSTYQPVHDCISPLSQLFHYCRSAVNFKFSIEINSEPRSFSLLIILVYFIIYEFKIVFLATKGYEGLMSEIIVAMTHMLGEMRYVYPVVMASMTTHHIEFVNSPVPGVVALWGKDTRYKKAVQYMKRKMMQEEIQNSQYQQSTAAKNGYMSSSLSSQICHLPTLIIDMNKHQFLYHEFSHKQLFLIENLHNYFSTYGKDHNTHDTKESNNLVAKMRIFFTEKLLAKGNNHTNSDQKWIQMLKERLERTQMYEQWIKWKSDKVKK